MPSSAEPNAAAQPATPRRWREIIGRWNRRLHTYLGLYLLCFVWLFAFTGLLLNHSQWKFAEFWANRRETSDERTIVAPPPGADLAQARDLMRQLGIRGEIEWTATRSDAGPLEFRVSQPGHLVEVHADLARNRAKLKRIDLNAWGVMRILHTFTGVRLGDTRNQRDWILTSVWAWTMDAVAAGLILMVLSSYFLWYELPGKRKSEIVVLALGLLSCGLFCVGLRFLY
jgi:hypothetical protein